jgi:hypothetical protein
MTPEQHQIAAAKRLGVNRPVDEVLGLVRALLDFDTAMAGKRKKAGCAIPIAILVTIAGFITAGMWKFGLVVPILGIAGVVAAIVLFVRFKSQDLSDNLRTAAVPFLAVVREDMNPGDSLHVNIDLRPYAIAEKKKKESEPYKKGAYYKIVDRLYVDPWFDGSSVLADGTKVRWNVIEHVLEHHKTKRTARGKIKSKTKIKRKTVAVVTLAFPTKHYAVNEADERDEKRATMTLARKLKTTDATSPAFAMLIDLIADGYKRAHVARSA